MVTRPSTKAMVSGSKGSEPRLCGPSSLAWRRPPFLNSFDATNVYATTKAPDSMFRSVAWIHQKSDRRFPKGKRLSVAGKLPFPRNIRCRLFTRLSKCVTRVAETALGTRLHEVLRARLLILWQLQSPQGLACVCSNVYALFVQLFSQRNCQAI